MSRTVFPPKLDIVLLLLDGREESVHFDKITSRIETLCYGLDMMHVDPVSVCIFIFINNEIRTKFYI